VTLLGLAAKNAILIVEYALLKRGEGISASAAAVEGARLRFRPILMTSLAFILGVLPLAISTGAGAGARHSTGTGVMGGMIAATFLAIFFVPLFFRLITDRRLRELRSKEELMTEVRMRGGGPPSTAHARSPAVRFTRRASIRRSVVLAFTILLAGCAVTQPAPPELDLPPGSATAAEQNELLERWWTAFDDPVLTALVDEALGGNLDLKGSLARIEAARAQVLLAQANLVPNTYLAGNAERSAFRGRRAAFRAERAAGGQRLPGHHRDGVRARRVGQVPQRRAGCRQ
jgi:hypothetical protein